MFLYILYLLYFDYLLVLWVCVIRGTARTLLGRVTMTIYLYSGQVQSSDCTTLYGREPTVTDSLTLTRVRPFRSQVRTYRYLYSSYIIKVWLTYIAVVIIITTKYPASARLKTLVGMQHCFVILMFVTLSSNTVRSCGSNLFVYCDFHLLSIYRFIWFLG